MARIRPTPVEIERHLNALQATPGHLLRLANGSSEEGLTLSPRRGVWSAIQILAHLRACSDVWTYSIYAMLTEDTPILPILDERKWAKAVGYVRHDFHRSLEAFSFDRAELIATLTALPEPEWNRSAEIGGRSHTVFSQCRRMALHELEHLDQIAEVLSGAR
jgi:hypothetical protein